MNQLTWIEMAVFNMRGDMSVRELEGWICFFFLPHFHQIKFSFSEYTARDPGKKKVVTIAQFQHILTENLVNKNHEKIVKVNRSYLSSIVSVTEQGKLQTNGRAKFCAIFVMNWEGAP